MWRKQQTSEFTKASGTVTPHQQPGSSFRPAWPGHSTTAPGHSAAHQHHRYRALGRPSLGLPFPAPAGSVGRTRGFGGVVGLWDSSVAETLGASGLPSICSAHRPAGWPAYAICPSNQVSPSGPEASTMRLGWVAKGFHS